MKRLNSSDSLGGLMSICPTSTDEHNQGNNTHIYTREFQSMLDGLDEEACGEESSGHLPEKKRRLSVVQVKALEKNFEVENKLEPERKVKLAQELGLQPRQVAVWFQNRRARWKTKQLERDYGVLKASFDTLKRNYDTLKHDNEAILREIRQLKGDNLQEDHSENNVEVKEEEMVMEQEEANVLVNSSPKCDDDHDATELNFESFNSKNGDMGAPNFQDFKDGSSDSDSSAILNEDNNNNNNNNSNYSNSSSGVVLQSSQSPHNFLISNGSPKSSCFQFLESSKSVLEEAHKVYQPHFVKIEDLNFFSGEEESCSTFFTDDQAPTLHWYNPEEWN